GWIDGPVQGVLIERRQETVVAAAAPVLQILRRTNDGRLHLLDRSARTQEGDKRVQTSAIGWAMEEVRIDGLDLVHPVFVACFNLTGYGRPALPDVQESCPIDKTAWIDRSLQ